MPQSADDPVLTGPQRVIGTVEDDRARVNRELLELLNEVRVALPGVQVLFAFLLTLPFTSRFESIGESEQRVYVATLLGSAVATALLLAPTAHHRLLFRRNDKLRLVRVATVLVIIGMAVTAMTVGGAVYLVLQLVEVAGAPAIVSAALTAATLVLWFVLPVLLGERASRRPTR